MRGRPAGDAWLPRTGAGSGPPALAFRVLTLFVAVCFLAVLGFALAPTPRPDAGMDRLVAVFYLAMVPITWFLMPRIRNGWGLDITLYVVTVVTFAGLGTIDDPAGRVLVGFAVVLFAVLAAYFLPRTRFLIAFAVMLGAYGVAVLLVPPALPVLYFIAIAFVSCTVAVFVSELVVRLRDQAMTDQLTGLLNRRGLLLMAQYVAAEAVRRQSSATVALIDLDDFKAYNDRHGHLAGDERLTTVADYMRGHLRASDIVARYGGDEFAVVLPGTSPERARSVLRRTEPEPGTFSVGVAGWAPGEDFTTALARADEDLYVMKGR